MSRYVPLHVHSHYSFLQAVPKVKEIVKRAKKEGFDAIALTDAGNLHGAVELYKTAKAEGMKGIIGVHAYLADSSRHIPTERDRELARVILLAENMDGYKNLLALVSRSFLEGFSEVPRVDRELLAEHGNGVIAILPAHRGPLAEALKVSKESAGATLADWAALFPGSLYAEITHHPELAGHTERMKAIISTARDLSVPVVANQEVYYLSREDAEAREVMRRIQQGRFRGDSTATDLSFRSLAEMERAFAELPDALGASGTIADRVSLSLSLGTWNFPAYQTEDGTPYPEALRSFAYEGFRARGFTDADTAAKERLEYELSVIIDKGFAPYFLVVSDLLREAKRLGILATTRGSAAGSFVSYVTGITTIDPLSYKLPFERFLNPERPKAPDIDMDYADTRRDEMIAYARTKYGDANVAQIGTFGTMMARAAVRDVSRALGHSYATGDRIAKLIPQGAQGHPMTIDRALAEEPDLKALYDGDEDAKEIMDLAKRIEGCARQTGVHAAGIVISPTPLTEWTPLQRDPKGGGLITQYDMHAVEEAGLLKFDFLGLTNLSVLADAIARVAEETGEAIDIENIPLDDEKTFALLASGETEGLFQLNGAGMTRHLVDLKPTTINDINAMVALYRPGPMESIPRYIERKKNPKLITYLDPRLADILDQSYGVITYQDDVLMTAITLAGYSWLEADTLRKAMGKKIPEEMEAQKEKLIKGFIEYGKLDKGKAEALWKLIEPFAGYGFNKAHAASYGKVAYQTAYMKAHHPVPYMAALLTGDSMNLDKIAILVDECARMGIPVLPPDVSESKTDFTVVPGGRIRFGLVSVKNFGQGVAEAIIAEREKHGPFRSLTDLLSRVSDRQMNRKALESLMLCGALDAFGERGHLLGNIETILAFHKDLSRDTADQGALFAHAAPPTLVLKDAPAASLTQKLAWEKELLGIYISGHPLEAYPDMLAKAKVTVKTIAEEGKAGFPVVFPALVTEVKSFLTKKGDKMVFLTLADMTGSIEAVAFPKTYKEHAGKLTEGRCALVKAAITKRNGETSLILEDLRALA